ncbi:MAG: metallophosphoesterase [Bacteroidales bacterium]
MKKSSLNRPAKPRPVIIKKSLWFLAALVFLLVVLFLTGMWHGRFNFRYKTVEIEYRGLPPALEGFTIVHISDFHLKSFEGHRDKLRQVTDSINAMKPDIIVNTGDFVTILHDEMEPFMDILGTMKARHGVYAIPGNHDTGLYSGMYDSDNYSEHMAVIGNMLRGAGHVYLQDSLACIMIDSVRLAITGVATYGRVPDLYYGDTDRAMEDAGSADFRILLSHDSNHWVREISKRSDIHLTLSGHTHGMQIGLLLPGVSLSPARLLYPAWYGLYGDDNNYLYVNPGLGTIGMPARIGMPPEITVIRLSS